eukprot:scaffold100774_cov30-Tisochrysis_lutea.AAC.5
MGAQPSGRPTETAKVASSPRKALPGGQRVPRRHAQTANASDAIPAAILLPVPPTVADGVVAPSDGSPRGPPPRNKTAKSISPPSSKPSRRGGQRSGPMTLRVDKVVRLHTRMCPPRPGAPAIASPIPGASCALAMIGAVG